MHVEKPVLVVRAPGELSAYVPTNLARKEPDGSCSFCPSSREEPDGICCPSRKILARLPQGEGGGAAGGKRVQRAEPVACVFQQEGAADVDVFVPCVLSVSQQTLNTPPHFTAMGIRWLGRIVISISRSVYDLTFSRCPCLCRQLGCGGSIRAACVG